jgi:hypothetical protein
MNLVIRALALLAGLAVAASATQAADRRAPTTPTNLRITGMTPYSVSLAWDPSTDNSGSFSYIICCANVSSQTVSGQFSSVKYTAGLEANRPKYSNSVSFTTPRDTTPPTKPLVSVTGVGPTWVSLTWSSIEEGPVWYSVFRDASPVLYATRDTAGVIPLLQPETTYSFTVRASDFPNNFSPLSDAAPATTTAAPEDHAPPTTPPNFYGQNWGCEVELDWDESQDDTAQPFEIRYEIFVNGVFDHALTLRYTRTIVYGTHDGPNDFSVVAVDTAGNRAAPATITLSLDGCP